MPTRMMLSRTFALPVTVPSPNGSALPGGPDTSCGRVEQTAISRDASAAAKGCEGCDFCRFRERAGSPTEDAGTCVRLPRPLAIGLDPENACSDLIIDANLAADDSALRLPTAASTHGPARCRHGRIFERRVAVASIDADIEARPRERRHRRGRWQIISRARRDACCNQCWDDQRDPRSYFLHDRLPEPRFIVVGI